MDQEFIITRWGNPLTSYFLRIAREILNQTPVKSVRGWPVIRMANYLSRAYQKQGWDFINSLEWNLSGVEFEPQGKESLKLSYPSYQDPYIIELCNRLIGQYGLVLSLAELNSFRMEVSLAYNFDKEKYWEGMAQRVELLVSKYRGQPSRLAS